MYSMLGHGATDRVPLVYTRISPYVSHPLFLIEITGRGGRISGVQVSHAGDSRFESMVESNQLLIELIHVTS